MKKAVACFSMCGVFVLFFSYAAESQSFNGKKGDKFFQKTLKQKVSFAQDAIKKPRVRYVLKKKEPQVANKKENLPPFVNKTYPSNQTTGLFKKNSHDNGFAQWSITRLANSRKIEESNGSFYPAQSSITSLADIVKNESKTISDQKSDANKGAESDEKLDTFLMKVSQQRLYEPNLVSNNPFFNLTIIECSSDEDCSKK